MHYHQMLPAEFCKTYKIILISYTQNIPFYPMTWLGTTRILFRGILQYRSLQCRDLPSVIVVSDINNGVMTTQVANNGHDDVTELPVTSQWFGML